MESKRHTQPPYNIVEYLKGASPDARARALEAACRTNEARANRQEWRFLAFAALWLGMLLGLAISGTIQLAMGAAETLLQCAADRATIERIAEKHRNAIK